MATNQRLPEVLARIKTLATELTEDAQWAFYDGYQPRGRDPESPHAVGVSPVSGSDPVKGPRWDTGQGVYRSREAFRKASRLILVSDVQLAWVICGTGLDKAQAKGIVKPDGLNLKPTLDALGNVQRRVGYLAHAELAPQGVALALGQLGGRMGAQRALELAQHRLRRSLGSSMPERPARRPAGALGVLEEPGTPAVEWCAICGIRPVPPRVTRCSTCRSYLKRHGTERPQALDGAGKSAYEEALAARDRRRVRGEGFGYA